MDMDIRAICQNAKSASHALALMPREMKDKALSYLADWLFAHSDSVLSANQLDLEDGIKAGLSSALIDRLTLTKNRIQAIAQDVRKVIDLPDPVGERFDQQQLPNGLHLHKQHVPLGVLAVIYESRPNVTVDVASLALKSGNAVILRGGSETIRSNRVLVSGIWHALTQAQIPQGAVQFIDDPNRELVTQLLRMHQFVDMLIPRGGAKLHNFCRENSSIPVITGGIGICHLFVDASANLQQALPLIRNAKIQRPTVCNALDTLLVHQAIACDFIPQVIATLKQDGVRFRLEHEALQGLGITAGEEVEETGADDFDTEWLSLVLCIKVVADLDEAIKHITAHSTGHSDGILTEDADHAERFIAEVDSAAVYVNASTRFTDGSQFGLGAEVAISTQRLHARGPMALRELTTYKWVAQGDYLVRE